jgi:hypothetical protein
MLITATLYVVLVWLLFSKLKLVRWGWFSGSVAVFRRGLHRGDNAGILQITVRKIR